MKKLMIVDDEELMRQKLETLVVKNAPTTAIREVMSSSRISISFICRLRNKNDHLFL